MPLHTVAGTALAAALAVADLGHWTGGRGRSRTHPAREDHMNGETNRDAWRDSVETWLKGDDRNDVFDGYLDWYRAPVIVDTDDWTRDFFVLPAVGSDVLHKHAGFVDGDSAVSVDDTTWRELSTLIGEAFATYAAAKA